MRPRGLLTQQGRCDLGVFGWHVSEAGQYEVAVDDVAPLIQTAWVRF